MEQTTLVSLCTFHEQDGGLGQSFYVNKERYPPLGRCSSGPGLVYREHSCCTFAVQGTSCRHFLGSGERAFDLRFSDLMSSSPSLENMPFLHQVLLCSQLATIRTSKQVVNRKCESHL